MGVLQFRKTQVTPFHDAAGGVGVDMAAQRRLRIAVSLDAVMVKILHKAGEPGLVETVALRMGR